MSNPQPADHEAAADPTDAPTPAEEAADPGTPTRATGEDRAAANRDADPPA